MGFLAFFIYNQTSEYLPFSIILLAFGIFRGIKLAEHVRKKHGLDCFFQRFIFSRNTKSVE
jgi:hypothetical protein